MKSLRHFQKPTPILAFLWVISFGLPCYGFPDQWEGGPFLGSYDWRMDHDWRMDYDGFVTAGLLISTAIFLLVISHVLQNIVNFLVLFYRTSRTETTNNLKSPAKLLLKIADFLPREQRKILLQEAADLKEEYEEAILFGKIIRARIIVISYYLGVGWSAFIWMADQVKRVIKISKK